MPPPRAMSTSSLAGAKSQLHTRRLSRISHSPSALSILLPPTPPQTPPPLKPPPISNLPPLIHLIGSSVDRIIRTATAKPTRKFVFDQRLAFQKNSRPITLLKLLLFLFLLLFILLFFLLRAFFGVKQTPKIPPLSPELLWRHNLARVEKGEQPKQYWPSKLAREKALHLPHPLQKSISISDIHNTQRHSERVWGRRPTKSKHEHVRLSLVAACQDRSAFLQTVLPGWCKILGDADEIILVDWGTRAPDHVPIAVLVQGLGSLVDGCQIVVVQGMGVGDWVLSRAYNLAVKFARGEWLLKLDCDTMVADALLDNLPLPRGIREETPVGRGVEDLFFYRYFWEQAATENDQHLNGVFLVRKDDFKRVNGYDERITTYGWDDSDLYQRLERDGGGDAVALRPVDFKPATLRHIKHGDEFRGANQHLVMGPILQTQVNQQATAVLPPWTKLGTLQESEYEFDLLSKDARFLAARIVRTPKPIMEQLTKQQQNDIIDEATNRVLHDVYGFPWSVLGEINRSRRELVRSLALLGRSTHWQSGNGFIFAEVGGSIAERLLAMSSAIGLAMEYERPLFLAWSSGTREEPTPRIADFFDVDSTGVIDQPLDQVIHGGERHRKGANVYQVGRWKCRSLVEVCASTDGAFKMMSEYRSGGHSDDQEAAQLVLDVLNGKVAGKRNVLLRLEGAFPLQNVEARVQALASLTPSHWLKDHLGKLGDLSAHLGIFVGQGVKRRGLDGMVKRVEGHYSRDVKYFVTGSQREIVQAARGMLGGGDSEKTEIVTVGATKDIRETIRDIAEVYGLAQCKSLVNDGRPPAAVLDVVGLIRQSQGIYS